MRNYAGSRKGICSYYLMYTFLVQLLRLKSSVFMVIFLNAFWYGNEAFPKGSSQNEVATLLIVFHLPYTKHWDVKYVFTRVVIKIKIFRSCRTRVVRIALMSHSFCSCSTCVAPVSHFCRTRITFLSHFCRTRVALMSLVPSSRVVNQTRSSIITFV